MEQEIEHTIHGTLLNDKVLVSEDSVDELSKRGYGFKDKHYYLYLYEALYLMYINKLVLSMDKEIINFDKLVSIGLTYDANLLTKFLIYRDLRSRGYVVREGFGFGADFRVYERGEYGNKQAKYVVFGLNEGVKIDADTLSKLIDQISRMDKEPIIAVIERRGEIIYYKLSKHRFVALKKFSLC